MRGRWLCINDIRYCTRGIGNSSCRIRIQACDIGIPGEGRRRSDCYIIQRYPILIGSRKAIPRKIIGTAGRRRIRGCLLHPCAVSKTLGSSDHSTACLCSYCLRGTHRQLQFLCISRSISHLPISDRICSAADQTQSRTDQICLGSIGQVIIIFCYSGPGMRPGCSSCTCSIHVVSSSPVVTRCAIY